jgi:superoxide dismutase
MTYFIVREGAIQEAFESLEQATARANAQAGASVIGDGWVTLASARDRVQQALLAIDEVAVLLDPLEVAQMKERLRSLETMLDAALKRLGLHG